MSSRIKPTFIIEWSIWDDTIGHHYEPLKRHTKELMYTLSVHKQGGDVCIGIITPELQETLTTVFGSRGIFSFLLENTVGIQPTQPLPFKIDGVDGHRLSIISLTFWETIKDSKNTFLVTEDEELKKIMINSSEVTGVKCNVVNSEEALRILKERGFEISG